MLGRYQFQFGRNMGTLRLPAIRRVMTNHSEQASRPSHFHLLMGFYLTVSIISTTSMTCDTTAATCSTAHSPFMAVAGVPSSWSSLIAGEGMMVACHYVAGNGSFTGRIALLTVSRALCFHENRPATRTRKDRSRRKGPGNVSIIEDWAGAEVRCAALQSRRQPFVISSGRQGAIKTAFCQRTSRSARKNLSPALFHSNG